MAGKFFDKINRIDWIKKTDNECLALSILTPLIMPDISAEKKLKIVLDVS
jgi:hypothetical protein